MSASRNPSSVGRVLLVGGGNMGAAMAAGWLAGGLKPADLVVVDPAGGAALRPLVEAGVRHETSPPAETFQIAILAVKPQVMTAVLEGLRPTFAAETMAISVAAGRTVASIEAGLGSRAIVRAMPNTPALIGRGITGAFANAAVSATQREAATALLAACGPVEWVSNEAEIDIVTGVSGSGPAYVFLLAEALAAAGIAQGLAPDLAMRLARHTVSGAGELLARSEETPETLRRNVTSPKGTTEAALAVLMADGAVPDLMKKAVDAARRRAAELSEQP